MQLAQPFRPSPRHIPVEPTTAELRRAIRSDELVLFYQPKVDLHGGRITGVEALARWQHPRLGLIGPDRFVPLAEREGLVVEFGDEILRKALIQAAVWSIELAKPLRVWVNVAAGQLAETERFDVKVRRALNDAGVSPEALGLEVTESTIVDNLETAGSSMMQLREIGVQIALDDFGTGYSSLSYLRRMPVDVLKIDRSFVSGVQDSLSDAAIVQAIVQLAHTMNLRVVAEGVETASQLAEISALHVDRAQGYLFSKPLPAAEITPLLRLPWCGVDVLANPALRMTMSRSDDLPGAGTERSRLLLSALDALTTPVVVSDKDAILYVNKSFERETGFSAERVAGEPYAFIDAQSPATDAARDAFYLSMADGTPTSFEVLAMRADGSTYPCEVTCTPVMNATGAISHWLTMRRDVSADREMDRVMEQQLDMRHLTATFAAACLAHPLDAPVGTELLESLVRDVAWLTRANRCFLDLVTDQGNAFESVCVQIDGDSIRTERTVTTLDRVPEWVALMDEDQVAVTAPTGPAPNWVLEQVRVNRRRSGAQIVAPLKVDGRVHGAFGVSKAEGDPTPWRSDEVDFVRTLADAAANFSYRRESFLAAQARSTMVEFKLAVSERLQASSASVLESLPFVLEGLIDLLGVDLAFIDLVDAESATYRSVCSRNASSEAPGLVDGEPMVGDIGELRFDASHPWFARLATLMPIVVGDTALQGHLMDDNPVDAPRGRAYLFVPFAVDGRLYGVLGLAQSDRPRQWAEFEVDSLRVLGGILANALERQRVEHGLRASEERFRLLAESSADVILVSDAAGLYTYVSPSVSEVLGYQPAELLGTSVYRLAHPDDRAMVQANRDRMCTEQFISAELRLRHAGGHWVWCSASLRSSIDSDGQLRSIQSSVRDVSARRAMEEELTVQAFTDELTGLSNRGGLQRHLNGGRFSDRTALMLFDLDRFKDINDRYGHTIGDRVLQAIAARLSTAVRSGDVVVRYGGDEFVVLCPHMQAEEAQRAAQRILERLHQPVMIDGHCIDIDVSVGVAIPAAVDDPTASSAGLASTEASSSPTSADPGMESLIRAADLAVCEAKRLGSGPVVIEHAGRW